MGESYSIMTAAMLAIGDELLSGHIKDKNIIFLAESLTECGIDLREARIVPDSRAAIIDAVNALRGRYDYIFTSGGIGCTHDDITAESVAAAFGRPCIFDPRAEAELQKYYHALNLEVTESRRLMARMPQGAELIANSVSGAPGFRIENCFIMAGVPQIFQAMLQAVLPQLKKSAPMISAALPCIFGESRISKRLGEIQRAFPQTSIGSYPQMPNSRQAENPQVEILLRSRDKTALREAEAAVKKMLADLAAQL